MNRNNLRFSMGGFAMLLGIVACAMPGQAARPAPNEGPNMPETTVISTSHARPEQTLQASPVSATPTFVPTETLTPTPKISPSGTSMVNLADGSTQFIDYRAGLQILIPSEWLAVRVGEQEYYQAWEKVGTQNPEFLYKFASIQNLDPNTFRMTAVDIRREHILYENAPTVDVIFAQDDIRTLNEVKIAETERHPALAEYKLLSSNFQETLAGLATVVIEFQWKSSTSASQLYMSYSKRVLFKVPTGTVSIDLHIPLDQKDSLGLEFDQIIGSLTLFAP